MQLGEVLKRAQLRTGAASQTMAAVEAILRDNWLDSQAVLRGLTVADALRLGISEPIWAAIAAEVGEPGENGRARETPTPNQIQEPKEQRFSVERTLRRFCEFEFNPDLQFQSLGILEKVVSNLRDRPQEPQFRRLKPSNAKLAKFIFDYESLKSILSYIGFREGRLGDWEVAEGEPDPAKVTEVLSAIEHFARQRFPGSAVSVPQSSPDKSDALEKVREIQRKLVESWQLYFAPDFGFVDRAKQATKLQRDPPNGGSDQLAATTKSAAEQLSALMAAATGKPWELEMSAAVSQVGPYLGNQMADVVIRIPLSNDLRVTLPSFFTLVNLYQALRRVFRPIVPEFGFKLAGTATVVRRGSDAMGWDLRKANLYPSGIVNLAFEGDLDAKRPLFN